MKGGMCNEKNSISRHDHFGNIYDVKNEKTIKGSGTRRKRFYLHIKMVVHMGHENMAHIF